MFYSLFVVDDELLVYLDGSAVDLTSTNHFYAKGENGWTPITLADKGKIQYSDLATIDYKLYGFISSDVDYNNYVDFSENVDFLSSVAFTTLT